MNNNLFSKTGTGVMIHCVKMVKMCLLQYHYFPMGQSAGWASTLSCAEQNENVRAGGSCQHCSANMVSATSTMSFEANSNSFTCFLQFRRQHGPSPGTTFGPNYTVPCGVDDHQ